MRREQVFVRGDAGCGVLFVSEEGGGWLMSFRVAVEAA